ncbi:MAG: glucokinase, partial [Xanthobacteraceae bacterium]
MIASAETGLIGDIGATNARFAVVDADGGMTNARLYALNDYSSLADTIDAYLKDQAPPTPPIEAVLAIASPIMGDQVTLTNHAWSLSIENLRRHLGLRRLRVINDFAANALAIPHLTAADRMQVGPG